MEKAIQVATPEQLIENSTTIDDDLDLLQEQSRELRELPLLPVRNSVLLPNVAVSLLVGRDQSIKAIEDAISKDHLLFAVTQLDETIEDPGPEDVYTVGVEGFIDRVLKLPDGTLSILMRGKRRLRRVAYTQCLPYLRVQTEVIPEELEVTLALEALRRAVLTLFEKCVKLSSVLGEDIYIAAMNIDQPGAMVDFIVSSLEVPVPIRQNILETFNVEERLQRVNILLSKELDILELENQIHYQVQQEVDKNQREYFLREQLKAIQRELGETDPSFRENAELGEKILSSGMPEEVKVKANKELDRLNSTPSMAPEGGVIRTYLDWLISLPWNITSIDQLDIKEAARIL